MHRNLSEAKSTSEPRQRRKIAAHAVRRGSRHKKTCGAPFRGVRNLMGQDESFESSLRLRLADLGHAISLSKNFAATVEERRFSAAFAEQPGLQPLSRIVKTAGAKASCNPDLIGMAEAMP